jgi:serine protease AprX
VSHPSARAARSRPALARAGGAAVVAALAAASTVTVASGPQLAAVAAYDGRLARVAGVSVVADFPGVGGALVRGDAAALARLARVPGVLGLSPDAPVVVTGKSSAGTGVYASEGLRGPAGTPQAGRGVRVAVVDTGVSDTVALQRASGRLVDAVDTSTVGDPDGGVVHDGVFADGYGHGTFLASLIAGGKVGGRHLGVAPAATVLNVRVARPDGTSSLSKVLAGLDWVVDHADEVDVVNLSLSKERPFQQYGADPLTHAVEQVRDAGVTVVVAAGNEAGRVGDPGFTPRALTVGAADLSGSPVVAPFSGSDTIAGVRKPDVVASGVGVLGVLPVGSQLAAASPPARADGLSRGTGTSQATAVVSGLAAVLLQRHPDATPAQVKASLRATGSDLPGTADGAGLVDAPKRLASGPDGEPLPGGSSDPTGETSFDASSWGAGSWGAGTWGAGTWGASSWAASSWAAGTWAAGTWAAGTWTGRFGDDA